MRQLTLPNMHLLGGLGEEIAHIVRPQTVRHRFWEINRPSGEGGWGSPADARSVQPLTHPPRKALAAHRS